MANGPKDFEPTNRPHEDVTPGNKRIRDFFSEEVIQRIFGNGGLLDNIKKPADPSSTIAGSGSKPYPFDHSSDYRRFQFPALLTGNSPLEIKPNVIEPERYFTESLYKDRYFQKEPLDRPEVQNLFTVERKAEPAGSEYDLLREKELIVSPDLRRAISEYFDPLPAELQTGGNLVDLPVGDLRGIQKYTVVNPANLLEQSLYFTDKMSRTFYLGVTPEAITGEVSPVYGEAANAEYKSPFRRKGGSWLGKA